MKNTFTKFGAVAVALAMSGLPAVALAEDVNAGGVSVQGDTVQEGNVQAGSVRVQQTTREDEQKVEITSAQTQGEESAESVTSVQQGEKGLTVRQGRIELKLERDDDRASSLGELRQKIELRKQELDDEEASSTPETRDFMKNANPVRLAVHALLASKDLIGGIGGQVSEIAKQMNDSVATTTEVEMKIKTRGFITRLLFGGDSTSADIIAKEAAKNQANITKLTDLLNQANVSADVQVTLKAQIAALQTAQTRLQTLAEREQKAWGLFSWRF